MKQLSKFTNRTHTCTSHDRRPSKMTLFGAISEHPLLRRGLSGHASIHHHTIRCHHHYHRRPVAEAIVISIMPSSRVASVTKCSDPSWAPLARLNSLALDGLSGGIGAVTLCC